VKFNEMDAFFTQNLAAIYKSIQDAGLTTNAQPSGLFFKWDEAQAKTEMAVAVPVTVLQDIKDLTSYHIPKKQGYVINHYGNRSLTKEAHMAMDEYFKDHNIIQDLPIMEEYVTDPLVEKDVKKWLTRIVYWKK
jgi:effector-binding domain-containing protein